MVPASGPGRGLRLQRDAVQRRATPVPPPHRSVPPPPLFDAHQHDYFRRFAGRSERELAEERPPVEPATTAMVRLLQTHRVPMAIVTGTVRPDVDLVLDRSGLATAFDVVVTEEDVRRGKPDPRASVSP